MSTRLVPPLAFPLLALLLVPTAGFASPQTGTHNFAPQRRPSSPEAPPAKFEGGGSTKEAVAGYVSLTDNRREVVNFNIETVRGMVLAPDGLFYALNTHASTVVVHGDLDGIPEFSWHTVLNPVAIAMWQNRVLVLGGGSHSLVLHDRGTGDTLESLPVGNEPADLVVDAQNGWAFVSCMGSNEVVKVELSSFTVLDRYPVTERPRSLWFDAGPTSAPGDNRVFVAPLLSGNNSLLRPPVAAPGVPKSAAIGGVVDLDNEPLGDLPDEDLFEIDPFQTGSAAVTPMLRGAGTLLNAIGRNPVTGAMWLLNTECKNKDPLKNTEPLLAADFADNRLSVAANLGIDSSTGQLFKPSKITDLDDFDTVTPGPQYSPSRSCAFPVGLVFHPNGAAFVTGVISDRMLLLDPNGNRLNTTQAEFNLPPGSVPHGGLLLDPTGQLLFVYLWNSNQVLVYAVGALNVPPVPLSLGFDPTPANVKRGRTIWYDGERSKNARQSCNHCHPGGGSDFLGWNLGDDPNDHKDLMVTQSLRSIEDTGKYHWRSERDLADFNAAFVGLLGASRKLDETPGGEADDFYSFVFSLQAPANAFESLTRTIDDTKTAITYSNGLTGSATAGQTAFINQPSLGALTCADCHTLFTGSNNEVMADFANFVPSLSHVEVAHFREMKHKDSATAVVAWSGVPGGKPYPRNGFGILHNGVAESLFDFIKGFAQLSPQQHSDVTSFVKQWDQGLSPAAHHAVLLDATHSDPQSQISNILLTQANSGWIDVVAVGTWQNPPATTHTLRWLFDPVAGNFVSNDPAQGPETLAGFFAKAQLGQASNLFLGLPLGSGRRFALDADNDELNDGAELALGTNLWNPDSDGDTWPDGYEVNHPPASPLNFFSIPNDTVGPGIVGTPVLDNVSTQMAKFRIEFDEPSTYTVQYQTTGGLPKTLRSFEPVRQATLVLQGLQASVTPITVNSYTPTITLTDLQGNPTPLLLQVFNSGEFQILGQGVPIRLVPNSFLWSMNARAGGVLTAEATIDIDHLEGTPQVQFPVLVTGQVVVAQVLTRDASGAWVIAPNTTSRTGQLHTSFQVRNNVGVDTVYGNLPGPFVISAPTDSLGVTKLEFEEAGLVSGDEVRINVLAILLPIPGYDPTNPIFTDGSLFAYELPTTPTEVRQIQTTY